MLIYDVLKKDHDELRPLLDRLVQSADADDATRKALIEKIRDELIPHSRAEEAIFYNSLSSIDVAKDLVSHSYAEHLEAEALLRALQGQELIGMDWTKTAQKFRDGVLHHIEEEEGRVFTAARQVLANEEAEVMADAFEKMKPEVREGGFMQNTIDLIANMMPDRFSTPLRNMLHKH